MSILKKTGAFKKLFPFVIVFLAGSLFIAFQSFRPGSIEPSTKYERILRNVGMLLEQGHYSPRKIDDSFSKDVLKVFTKDLDEDKSLFLQSDIDGFKKYESSIDDEIHGTNKLESFFSVVDIYHKRLVVASQPY